MRSFKFKNGLLFIKSPEAGIASFAQKFNLPIANNGKALDASGISDARFDEIRDTLLQAGYAWN